jgi:hypothetical protein
MPSAGHGPSLPEGINELKAGAIGKVLAKMLVHQFA